MKRNNTIEKIEKFLRHCGYEQGEDIKRIEEPGSYHCFYSGGKPHERDSDAIVVTSTGTVYAVWPGEDWHWHDITSLMQGAMKR